MSRARSVYLVDGSGQFHRAFHAIRGLATSKGLPTNATYGFTTMLRKLLEDEKPEHMAVVFDPPGTHLPPRRLRGVQGQPPADGQGPRAAAALHPARVRGAAHAGDRGPGLRGGRRDRDALAPGGRAGPRRRRGLGRQGPAAARRGPRARAEPRPRGQRLDELRPPRRRGEVGRPARADRGRAGARRRLGRQHSGSRGHRRQGRARPGARVRPARGRARRTPTR